MKCAECPTRALTSLVTAVRSSCQPDSLGCAHNRTSADGCAGAGRASSLGLVTRQEVSDSAGSLILTSRTDLLRPSSEEDGWVAPLEDSQPTPGSSDELKAEAVGEATTQPTAQQRPSLSGKSARVSWDVGILSRPLDRLRASFSPGASPRPTDDPLSSTEGALAKAGPLKSSSSRLAGHHLRPPSPWEHDVETGQVHPCYSGT